MDIWFYYLEAFGISVLFVTLLYYRQKRLVGFVLYFSIQCIPGLDILQHFHKIGCLTARFGYMLGFFGGRVVTMMSRQASPVFASLQSLAHV